MSELVFVYGTLRREASNAFRMEAGELVAGECYVRGRLYRIDWYPGLKLDESAGWVRGEVWRVSAEQLVELDEFEGVSTGENEEYRRVRHGEFRGPLNGEWAVLENAVAGAWVWEWTGREDEERLIPSGDWMDVEQPRQRPVCTILGCLSVPAIPIGVFALSAMVARMKLPPIIERGVDWIWMGVFLAWPFGIWVLASMGTRRRESGKGYREIAGVCAVIAMVLSAGSLLAKLLEVIG